MYGYIYLTENLINGKRYIGQKKGPWKPSYKGSGVLIKKAIEKYGPDNFKPTLLEWCNSKEELDQAEIKWISHYDATNSSCFYNTARGGEGHTCAAWNKGKKGCYKASEKQLASLSKSWHKPASEKLKKRLSEIRTGCEVSESTRNKLREAVLGRKKMIKGQLTKMVNKNDVQAYLRDGWEFKVKVKGSTTNS